MDGKRSISLARSIYHHGDVNSHEGDLVRKGKLLNRTKCLPAWKSWA